MFRGHYDDEFLERFEKLPADAKKKTRAALKKWKHDNNYNSLFFKALFRSTEGMIYSMRVDGDRPPGYRIVGRQIEADLIIWQWVGKHDEYMRRLEAYTRS